MVSIMGRLTINRGYWYWIGTRLVLDWCGGLVPRVNALPSILAKNPTGRSIGPGPVTRSD